MIKILVTGANGQLGNELRVAAKDFPYYDFIFTDIEELDITSEQKVDEFFKVNEPDAVINCVAYTAVDKAEDEPEKAMWLNRDAVSNLSCACDRSDSFLIHISSDFIFDGKKSAPYREDDIPSPVSAYGLTKLAGEGAMMSCLQRGIIIRTSWLYSSYGNNFVKTIITKGTENNELKVVADQVGSPTYAGDLARAILKILPTALGSQQMDIFNYSNEGQCSWYEFALVITELAGLSCRIVPVDTTGYPTKARRPAYSVLDNSKIKERFGLVIPGWKESLAKCVENLGLKA